MTVAVADLNTGGSVQPPPRRTVKRAVLGILDGSPANKYGIPDGHTHRDLACAVYETQAPTRAHLSAVRRAVARLVAEGLAERDSADRQMNGWGHTTAYHWRWRDWWEAPRPYRNPAGVLVRRPQSAHEAQQWEAHASAFRALRDREGS